MALDLKFKKHMLNCIAVDFVFFFIYIDTMRERGGHYLKTVKEREKFETEGDN